MNNKKSLIIPLITLIILFSFNFNPNITLIITINIVSLFSILSSAINVIKHADVLSHKFGEPYGSLILALSIVVLEVGLISTLIISGNSEPTIMRDTLYSVIIIVLAGLVGFSLLIGGYKHSTQYVNFVGIKKYIIAIIPLAILILVLPSSISDGRLSTNQMMILSFIPIMIYISFLIIQTKTHNRFFIFDTENNNNNHNDHKINYKKTYFHFFYLLIYLTLVISITKMNSNNLELLLNHFNAPSTTLGFIIALLILSPEGIGAIKAVIENKVQKSMNIFFGSVLATISLTVPIITIISIFLGEKIIFGLDIPSSIILVTTLILTHISFSSGKTTILNGTTLLAMFIGYLMTLFI